MRGEQGAFAPCFIVALGSPPLARGTVLFARAISCGDRITPACAGNSIPMKRSYVKVGDHPRLRGEQTAVHLFSFLRLGSPPLARGTESIQRNRSYTLGITPACAGNRVNAGEVIWNGGDHPRLRGEQTKKRLVVSCILQYRFSFFNQFFVDMFC